MAKPDVGGNVRVLEQHRADNRDIPGNGNRADVELIAEWYLLHTANGSGDKDSHGRREHIQCRTADNLVGFHVDGGIGM